MLNQCIYLIKSGSDLSLFLAGDKIIDLSDYDFIQMMNVPDIYEVTWQNIIKRVRYQYKLRDIIINILNLSPSSDILYMRYPYPLFYSLWPFSLSQKKCKIITEHNTIEEKEFKLTGLYLLLLIELIMGGFLRKKSSGIVGVTDEITSYELNRSGDINKPHITIGNGINVDEIGIRNPPKYDEKELHLLCVASVSRWHGLDRLLKGLALYRGKTRVHLCIAGNGKEILNLKALVNDLNLKSNVVFTGFMGGRALDDLFDKSHIAVGSLGIHRKGLIMTSELKIREYTARGIPFVCSAVDPDLPDDFLYAQKVPADEGPIDIEVLIRFAEKVYLDPEHHIRMRAYAKEKLDWSIKMKKLKEFCDALVEG